MVFHGDYEVEFEIYEKHENGWRSELLGHMVGVSPQDAKRRWLREREVSTERHHRIQAIPVMGEWRSK